VRAIRFISGTKLDERVIRCDLDPGYTEGRQYGRGKSGGQVNQNFVRLLTWVLKKLAIRFEMSTARILILDEVAGVHKLIEKTTLITPNPVNE
jgi:hypothetical protein